MTGDSHILLGVASGNVQHEALTDGIRQHDDCSLLSQPITAYDLQVRYDKTTCPIASCKSIRQKMAIGQAEQNPKLPRSAGNILGRV